MDIGKLELLTSKFQAGAHFSSSGLNSSPRRSLAEVVGCAANHRIISARFLAPVGRQSTTKNNPKILSHGLFIFTRSSVSHLNLIAIPLYN